MLTTFDRGRKVLLGLFLVLSLFLVSCGGQGQASRSANNSGQQQVQKQTRREKREESKRFDETQKETRREKRGAATEGAIAGGSFNKFFPKSGGDFTFNFTQEKKGVAEAKAKKDGKEVAKLSISDTKGNPTAADKFKGTDKTIAGYPAVKQGKNATAVLVGNRYQVKVRSTDPDFTNKERANLIRKFDLKGLEGIKNAK